MKNEKKIFIYLIIAVIPVIVGIIYGAINKTFIFKLDSIFNQFSNDEIGYYRAVKQMRLYGLPVGYNGYDERLTTHLTFGYYNYLTYFLYYIFSFFININGHNYIFVTNLIFLFLSNMFVVFFLRPNKYQSIYLLIFNCFNVFTINCCFSSMSEGQHILGISIIMSLIICLYKDNNNFVNKKVLSLIIILFILYFGIIRPTMLLFFIYLFIYNIYSNDKNNSRVLICLLLVFLFCFGCLLYLFLNKNFGAPYFYNDNYMQIDELLEPYIDSYKKLGLYGLFVKFINVNILHFINIIKNFYKADAGANICVVLGAAFVLFIITIFKNIILKTDRLLVIASAILIFLWFYVHMIFYNLLYMNRLFIVPLISMSIVICFIDNSICKRIFLVLFSIVSIMFIMRNKFVITIPNNTTCINTSEINNDLIRIMPKTSNLWDNTVAIDIPPMKNSFMYFLIPDYIGEMCCTNEYLSNNLSNHSLKSKYMFISIKNDTIYNIAIKNNYKIIYEKEGFCLFLIH